LRFVLDNATFNQLQDGRQLLSKKNEVRHDQALKLSSSQALKLSSSQAGFFRSAVVGLIVASGGCDSLAALSVDATVPIASQSGRTAKNFDAGVLFANEASYLCIPLERLGIGSAQEILSIKSSCECVRPSAVRYVRQISQDGVALRLDFVKDSQAQDNMDPVSLAVTIKLQLASGIEQSVTIQFLHTTVRGRAL